MCPRKLIAVEVVYAQATQQDVRALEVPVDSTVREAITCSGLLGDNPELDLGSLVAGVFGRRQALTARLRVGDRVEIYRPLPTDPRARRRLAVSSSRGEE